METLGPPPHKNAPSSAHSLQAVTSGQVGENLAYRVDARALKRERLQSFEADIRLSRVYHIAKHCHECRAL
jgi:hypothetical protein